MLDRRNLGPIVLAALLYLPAACAGAADAPKVTHDWPAYTGPEGTFADQSRVPILEDLSKAKLLWATEIEDLGYGKTTSGGGHRYGEKSRPSGSCSLIVADGLVIVTYFTPKNSVQADDVILALDAATGKLKWKQVYAGKGLNRGAGKHLSYGPTPAAADGKVFHLGSAGLVYAVDLATGKPLWEAPLGDYPKHYQALAAAAQQSPETKGGVGGRQTVNPLIVIDGVLMVPCALPRLYAYDAATGKELWDLDGVKRAPSPAKINGRTYAFCTGGGFMRLVEPKSGKVLWSEKNNIRLSATHGFVVADGRAFVAYAPGEAKTGPLAAFALSETGAKLLWQSKDEIHSDEATYFAYRDGVLYAQVPDTYVKAFKAEDGTLLSDLSVAKTMSLHGHMHLWGDRLVLVGDDCHESLGKACFYQSCTPGPKDIKLTGQTLAPRTFNQYQGVGGYECWMRPPFADGLMFNRSVNTENGNGVILAWDLRAQSGQTTVDREIQAAGADAHAVVSRLLSLATDADVQVREAAGRKLAVRVADGQASSRQAEVLPVLLRLTAENDPFLRRQLASALAAFGTNSLPTLAGASRQPNENVRSSVVEALGHLGGVDDPRIDDILVAALGETNPVLVETALNSVVKRTGKLDLYQPLLVKLIDAAERPVDRTALGTLLMLLPESTLPTPRPKKLEALLIDLMATRDAARGQRAVAAIRSLGDDEARRIFTSVLQEGDSTSATRLIRAIKGLAEMGGRGKPALPALEQALERWKNWKKMSTTLQAAIKAIQEAKETGDGLTAVQGVVKD